MLKHSRVESASNPSSQAIAAWIGIDLGDRWSEVCILDDTGSPIERTRVKTTPQAFEEYFSSFAGCQAALETGSHSSWASRALTRCGLTAIVANAREVRKIHQSHRKNDRADAEILARLLRFDSHLLSPIQHRGAQMQDDIAIVRARDTLIRSRTMCINAVRGLAKTHGIRLVKRDSSTFAKRAAELIPAALQPALGPLLETIGALSLQIRGYDEQIESLASQRYPEIALVTQVAGVGSLTALTFVLTLASPQRFASSRDVGPFLGLVPRQYDSGDHRSQLPISKAGNSYLRKLLVGSAQYILGPFGPDCALRRYGQRLQKRGGGNGKKRAVVAVARKLAVLLHHLWATGAVYDPYHGISKAAAA